MPKPVNNLKLWAAILCITFLAIEVLTFSSTVLLPHMYDTPARRQQMMEKFNINDYKNYIGPANGMRLAAHPVMGWDNSVNNTRVLHNCVGVPKTHTNLDNGIRSHISDADAYIKSKPMEASILLIGDSYTYGSEANDEETYPAQLEKKLGIKTANLGAVGYCPLQALLKLEENIQSFPQARFVVLGIMYEDMMRMLNSYRPAYVLTDLIYGFKPYFESGQVMPVSKALWEGFDQMKQAAEIAMDHDYLARPLAKFPYTLSFIRALSTPAFQFKIISWYRNITGQPKAYLYLDTPGIKEAYNTLLQRYLELAKNNNVRPVLVFMPANALDTTSGEPLMDYARKQFGDSFIYVSVGKGIDWTRYNIDKTNCHPSAYGYERIADAVAKVLKSHLGEDIKSSVD